jgi:hypothetical protein
MPKLIFVLTILLQWCLLTIVAEKKNLNSISSKIKDTAVATQSSLSKFYDEGSNDSNEFLYDLLVYSVTINGTQIKPGSKSSKQPSPTKSPANVVAIDDDDNADADDDNLIPVEEENSPSPVPTIATMSNTSVLTLNATTDTSLSNSSSNETNIELTETPSPSPSKVADVSSLSSPIATAVSTAPTNLDECPKAFNRSIAYHEFDVVSRSSIVYECKRWPRSSYCNSFEPGSEHSDRGWTVVGHCLASPTQSPFATDNSSGTSVVSIQSPVIISSTDQVHLSPSSLSPSSIGSPPAVINPITLSPTTPSTSVSSTVFGSDDELTVKLPRIICDISISPSLEQLFEQKHTLLVAMTNTLYGIFDLHLNKAFYDITGIKLSVSVTMNEKTSGSMLRLKADFTGSVLFSPGSIPTSIQLIDILLRHFSVEDFTKRLALPSKARTTVMSPSIPLPSGMSGVTEEPIKVNTVFFSVDGMLIQAGASYNPVRSSTDVNGGTLANDNIQLAIGVFVLTAFGFALAMVLFIGHVKRSDLVEVEDTASQGPSSVPIQTNARAESHVEVAASCKNFFGGLDGISDVSSMSESPCTERSTRVKDIAPMTPSLGIVAPNHRYRSGVRVLYPNDESIDYDTDEWKRRSCLLETP